MFFVLKELTKLKVTKASYPDGITARLLKDAAPVCYAGNLLEEGQLANQTERRVVGTATRRFIPQMNVVSTSKTPQQHVT